MGEASKLKAKRKAIRAAVGYLFPFDDEGRAWVSHNEYVSRDAVQAWAAGREGVTVDARGVWINKEALADGTR